MDEVILGVWCVGAEVQDAQDVRLVLDLLFSFIIL
jgi:hypothetical protein